MIDDTSEKTSTKVCSKCGGEPKPLSEFYRNSASKDGRTAACANCRRQVNAASRCNPLSVARQRARTRRHFEKVLADPDALRRRNFKAKASRARRLGALVVDLTYGQWEYLLDVYDYRCAYCGRGFEYIDFTIDHVLPLSKGGQHTLDNVVPSCFRCNVLKRDRVMG